MAEVYNDFYPGPAKPSKNPLETEVLFNSIGEGAITTDKYGRITRVNRIALAILGFKEDELKGKWFPKVIVALDMNGQTLAIGDRHITQAFLTGAPVSGRSYYLTKAGRQVPVATNVAPIMYRGQPLGALEVFRDISAEMEVDRMKSEFISLASHQLRTPLSAIKTYTHMLTDGLMGELNSSQKESLETIIGASNRMNELISMLLNVTRIESGSIAVNKKLLSLDSVIKELLPELGLMAENKKVHLGFRVSGPSPTKIKTDALIIKEVVTNLVSNAIKYTPEDGQVEIIVRPKKAEILVQIKDSGWGIPGTSQKKIFSKFFRGPNIIKRETSGTGLGLYLVKGLLEVLDGKIWFKSREGVGSSFYFTLPRGGRKK